LPDVLFSRNHVKCGPGKYFALSEAQISRRVRPSRPDQRGASRSSRT
jgi:hypothetical protein